MYTDQSLRKYLDDLAGKLPAPGGGSAAAATGAIGTAALSMVANFTIGKEKYKDVEQNMRAILEKSENIRAHLQHGIDDDVIAYQKVSKAYGMPKNTDAEKQARSSAIQEALKEAMKVPLSSVRNLFEAIKLCEPLLEQGNINLASDVGVGAELISAAFASSVINVQINLASIKDEKLTAEIRNELECKEKELNAIKEKIIKNTREKIT